MIAPHRKSSDSVREILQQYADRGIFREFGETIKTAGRSEYRFRWLTDAPLHLIHDKKAGTLTWKNLLPAMPARSAIYADFKSFIEGRASKSLPEHRRIDPKKAEIVLSNRAGRVSVALKIKGRNDEYAARKAVNLVNEIFNGFLTGPYYDYMVENFHISEE